MSTLNIHLQIPHNCWYHLSPISGCKLGGRITVDNTVTLKRGDYSRVVRGRLRIDASSEEEAGPSTSTCKLGDRRPKFVVLKIVRTVFYGRSLKREAENYELAKDLQGTVIPRSYGLYHGATPDGFVTVLMLEYVGNPRCEQLMSSPVDFNLLTLEKLIKLHDAGFIHGCVKEEHVISPGVSSFSKYDRDGGYHEDDGGPFLISLSSLRPHRCTRTLPIVESTLRPASQVFGCDELWIVASQMGIWNPGEIAYFSEAVPLSYARTPEQLARAAPLRMQSTAAGWAEALRQARTAINAFKARFPIEEDYDYDGYNFEGRFEGSESGSNEVVVSA
ncbi:hypothetical protein SCHPADRAFT_943673 [Schizopora paradoxa]|uniref:Protein kinase domain-containing protein n=1 Tax=Schizopora paradoxa TaxID=27342 RepID=A0A0H2RIW2_9AGAM|nr:hypothetical protein SCHPADRAFT_943673 [Schizopora paradoxa]